LARYKEVDSQPRQKEMVLKKKFRTKVLNETEEFLSKKGRTGAGRTTLRTLAMESLETGDNDHLVNPQKAMRAS